MIQTAPQRVAPPRGACDTHVHVFDAAAPRVSTGPAPLWATTEALQAMHKKLGIDRVVLVQGGTYRTDNQVMVKALATLGACARGVAAIDRSVTDAELQSLTDAGVRGARFHMLPGGFLTWDDLLPIAARIAPFGWHIQLQLDGRLLPELEAILNRLSVQLVIDHVGKFLEPVTTYHPGFQVLLRLLAGGRTWMKLSAPYEVSRAGPPTYDDVGALAKAAVAVAPDRLFWASNWPHGSLTANLPDDRMLLDVLADWVPDDTVRNAILRRILPVSTASLRPDPPCVAGVVLRAGSTT